MYLGTWFVQHRKISQQEEVVAEAPTSPQKLTYDKILRAKRLVWSKPIQIIIDDKIVVDSKVGYVQQCVSYYLQSDTLELQIEIQGSETIAEISVFDILEAMEE